MPVPPRKPIQFVCPICKWKGPQLNSDVFYPSLCPDCGSKTVLRAMNPVSVLLQLWDNLRRHR